MRSFVPKDDPRNRGLHMVERHDTAADDGPGLPLGDRPLEIMVVGDNSETPQALLNAISSLGYQADHITSALEAIDAVGQQEYDVVLLDAHMPELNGAQTAKLMRAHTGSAIEPWIVVLTGPENYSQRSAWTTAGVNGFLSKPLRTDDLAAVLGHIVANHAAQLPGPPEPKDRKQLHNFLNRDYSRPVLEAYLADAHATLCDLRAYAGAGDFDAVRRKAHYLKGSSMIVGASGIGALCRELELRAAAQQPLETILDALHHAVKHTADALASS